VDTSFAITANASGTGSTFSPTLPTSGTTVSSSADARENGLSRSKANQPEAVPRLNTDKVGRGNRAILGLAALKEGLLVLKEDGVHLVSGESDGGGGFLFALDELDPTIRIKAPNSLAILDNSAYFYSDQGVYKMTTAGGGIVSRPLEVEFNKRSKSTNFAIYTRGTAYESDRAYLISMQDASGDVRAKTTFRQNYLVDGQPWTDWDVDFSIGHVKTSDDKLYVLHNVDFYVLQERKSFTTNDVDYMDETIAGTVTGSSTTTWRSSTVSTATITWTYATPPAIGWLFEQGANSANVVAVVNNGGGSFTLTLDSQFTINNAACELTKSYLFQVEWAPESGGNAAVLKRFAIASIMPEIDRTTATRLGFKSDMMSEWEYTSYLYTTRTRGFGSSAFGSSGWGSASPGAITAMRTFIPRDQGTCRSLGVRVENRYAGDALSILQLSLDVTAVSTRHQSL
jgi:hypothetical protein